MTVVSVVADVLLSVAPVSLIAACGCSAACCADCPTSTSTSTCSTGSSSSSSSSHENFATPDDYYCYYYWLKSIVA